MDDDRIMECERSLWIGDGDVYRQRVSDDCLMVVPERPFLLRGNEAINAVQGTPRWSKVDFSEFEIKRPQDGLIVVAYHVDADRGHEHYSAYCTSTYRRRSDDDWVVIQHQQTPPQTRRGDEVADMREAQASASEERENQRGYQ